MEDPLVRNDDNTLVIGPMLERVVSYFTEKALRVGAALADVATGKAVPVRSFRRRLTRPDE